VRGAAILAGIAVVVVFIAASAAASDITLGSKAAQAAGLYSHRYGRSTQSLASRMRALRASAIADRASTAQGQLGREYLIEGLSSLIAFETVRQRTVELMSAGVDPTSPAMHNLLAQRSADELVARAFIAKALQFLGR